MKLLLLLLTLSLPALQAATLQVGPNRPYQHWCDAVATAHDGDTIEIDGGNTYTNEACVVYQNNLTIRGIGSPRPILHNTFSFVNQSNGKATVVVDGSNVTIEGIEFDGPSGAADNCVDPGDGKHVCTGSVNAVRIEGPQNKAFTMRNCLVRHVEMGVLSSVNLPAGAEVLIENSEFTDNCVSEWGPGYVHNVYINKLAKFTFRYNYSHRCYAGILVKSRAAENWILYNRITDEVSDDKHLYFPAGYPSTGAGVPPSCASRLSQGLDCTYDLEPDPGDCHGSGGWCYSGANNALQCTEAGHCYVIGNLFQQGPHSVNHTIIQYAVENNEQPGRDFYFINNTVVNEQQGTGWLIVVGWPGSSPIDTPAKVWNNLFYTPGKMSDYVICGQNGSQGPAPCDMLGNIYTSVDPFVDRKNYDYHLKADSQAIGAGADPGTAASGASLTPTLEYLYPTGFTPRPVNGTLDAGAYEYTEGLPPAILTASLPAAVAGRPYSYQLAATGEAPLVWSASGLPSWAAITPGGLLQGTPEATGTMTLHVTVKNASAMDAKDLVLTVRPVPTRPARWPWR